MMMTGWKTWVAAICMAGLGFVQVFEGATEAGITQIVAALALVGLGHKIEKNGKPVKKTSRVKK